MAADQSGAEENGSVWQPCPIPMSKGGWRPIMVARVVTSYLELQQARAFSGSLPQFAAAEHHILALLESAWGAAVNHSPSFVRADFWRGAAPDTAWLALHAAEEALLPLQADDV